MAKLPYSRTVLVTMSRNDAFPTRRGFGTPLMLVTEASPGQVDATNRTKLYASIEEVTADWATTSDFYKAALEAFSQDPRPIQIKAGFVALDTGATDDDLIDELDAVHEYDTDFYWITVDSVLRAQPDVLAGLIAWVEAKSKLAIIDTNDPLLENPADTTNIAAVHKGTVERTAVFYHTDPEQWPALALASMLGTRNFDEADSAYTAKYKRIRSVPAINKGSAAVTAITGFIPQVGQSDTAGHLANTQIDIGGRDFVVEGSVLTANVFIDEIHATDWIIARTEEESLGILLNNSRVPYTDQGMEQLASAARTVMRQASRAGLIADDLDPETGDYAPAVIITVPSVFDVPESQRKARIAPEIHVRFRYAGAVHYTTIRYQMTF